MTRQEKQEALIQERLRNSAAIQQFIKSEAHDLIVKPIEAALGGLKSAYDCTSLREMAALKGEYRGLTFVLNLIEGYQRGGLLAGEQAQKLEAKKAADLQDFDSTDL